MREKAPLDIRLMGSPGKASASRWPKVQLGVRMARYAYGLDCRSGALSSKRPNRGNMTKLGERAVAVIAIAISAVIGLGTGVAVAQTDSTGWVNYSNWTFDGANRCADGMARVYTLSSPSPYSPEGVGYTRYRAGSPCSEKELPTGYLGVKVFLARGDGTICGQKDWVYNSYPTGDMGVAVTPNCSFSYLRAVDQSRVYRGNIGDWRISDLIYTSLIDG